ncbi:MAG TPA: asparagine synthase (glutamine-hydrolyzing) [Chthonomonadaceae bacterium]|nr:asparagine synthase (glutamine-hydrolyzing) [Chthonomonadaceae bacterium]
MCGITALCTVEPSDDLERLSDAMLAQIKHRGPDLQASFVARNGRISLGHARLSIVDLSPCGSQPMPNETEDLWLVCNGEIYNHVELRRSLEARGHRFRSRSDCETILHLYEEHGEAAVDHLHGMFAFVLYDVKADALFCARDRLGKKPIVYAETRTGVALASEVPAVLPMPGIDTSVEPAALGLYMLRNLRHIPDPWTLYRGVRRLPPGHAMRIAHGRVERIWRYWRPDFTTRPGSPAALRAAFDRAVALRRVADVEVGALLSGGVDSSAIVQAMIAQGSECVRTYAMGRDADDEELARARTMAQELGTIHREFTFDAGRQHDQFELLIRNHGEPIVLLPLTFALELCQHIRDDGLRVVLTGHGADELFYGYDGNNNLALLSAVLPFVPTVMRPILGAAASRFSARSPMREALLVAASPAGARKAALYRDEARSLWRDLFCFQDLDRLIEDTVAEWLDLWFQDQRPDAYIDEANIIGLMHENSHSVTIAGDLPAMAASVEARCPFLDQELVQLAWNMDYHCKVPRIFDKSRNKGVLKQALDGRIPRSILYAPKRGFGYHISEEAVLRGAWKARVDAAFAELDSLGGLLNVDAARSLKARFDRGEGVPAMQIAKLYGIAVSQRLNAA